MTYNHSEILFPYGNDKDAGTIGIDKHNLHGYWEYPDGTEGGELLFERDGDLLILVDYDGAFELPRRVVNTLRNHGYVVDEDF
jgi:hypothetical protein